MNLNYSKQKGLYVSTSELVELSIVSHDEKGFLHKLAKQSITIPGNGICVKVDTNFGYGIRSYHRANVSIVPKTEDIHPPKTVISVHFSDSLS